MIHYECHYCGYQAEGAPPHVPGLAPGYRVCASCHGRHYPRTVLVRSARGALVRCRVYRVWPLPVVSDHVVEVLA